MASAQRTIRPNAQKLHQRLPVAAPRWILGLLLLATIWPLYLNVAWAAPLEAWIDKSEQTMTVYYNDDLVYRWPVSTARPGKVTPTGTFIPKSLKRYHFSTIYNNAPMPFSIFFSGNYAIHGTEDIDKLGCPASAGCVRLHPDNAEILFNLTRETGLGNTRIIIQE